MLGEAPRQNFAWKKFTIFVFIEPSAFYVEEMEPGQLQECQRVKCEPEDRLVGARIRLIIEDVDGAIADLQKINVAGDGGGAGLVCKWSSMAGIERGDFG